MRQRNDMNTALRISNERKFDRTYLTKPIHLRSVCRPAHDRIVASELGAFFEVE